ncbi:MAG: hypothetical protein K5669_06100 [Lachnospiraceae bacterium]|nr:hypothetical protein [Lachnospiraceae bacterium]
MLTFSNAFYELNQFTRFLGEFEDELELYNSTFAIFEIAKDRMCLGNPLACLSRADREELEEHAAYFLLDAEDFCIKDTFIYPDGTTCAFFVWKDEVVYDRIAEAYKVKFRLLLQERGFCRALVRRIFALLSEEQEAAGYYFVRNLVERILTPLGFESKDWSMDRSLLRSAFNERFHALRKKKALFAKLWGDAPDETTASIQIGMFQ